MFILIFFIDIFIYALPFLNINDCAKLFVVILFRIGFAGKQESKKEVKETKKEEKSVAANKRDAKQVTIVESGKDDEDDSDDSDSDDSDDSDSMSTDSGSDEEVISNFE